MPYKFVDLLFLTLKNVGTNVSRQSHQPANYHVAKLRSTLTEDWHAVKQKTGLSGVTGDAGNLLSTLLRRL